MQHFSQNFPTFDLEFEKKNEISRTPKKTIITSDLKQENGSNFAQQPTQNTIPLETMEILNPKRLTLQINSILQSQLNRTSIDYQKTRLEFKKKYEILKILKQTTCYQILECQDLQNKQLFVVKVFFDNKNNDAIQELQINQTLLKHPHKNIMKLIETFEEGDKCILVYEHLSGGTLFNFLISRQLKLKEKEIRSIVKQILRILAHLHSLNIMHRDIKLDNIMFQEPNNIKSLKLIDFGLSSFVKDDNSKIRCGTPGYIAPEIFLKNTYNELCDIYSLGAVLHILATGKRIFSSKCSLPQIYKMNQENQYRISSNLKCPLIADLIHSMLSDVNTRPSAQQCLKHPFFTNLSESQSFQNPTYHKTNQLNFPQFKNPFCN